MSKEETEEESGKITTLEDINEFIQDTINPGLAMHGGYLKIVDYNQETGVLDLFMGGGCQGCASSTATLKLMITTTLTEEFPGITSIEDATDHSAGMNPYY